MFQISKKILCNLNKCYSLAPLTYKNKPHFLVAAEKTDPCLLFDLEGNQEAVVWEQPGGVMSMVQVPGSDGQFLATHQFYSPNDSKEARIVIAAPTADFQWEVRTLCSLPHVHRFDILQRNGRYYLIACALKSGHEYKDDWSMPGKVYAAELPSDLSVFSEANPLPLQVIQDNMTKNHGYYRIPEKGYDTSIISCEEGIYQFIPPSEPGKDFSVEKILDLPSSDAVIVDLDGDGEKELVVLSPFHGENISIYKKQNGSYAKIYDYPYAANFTHAIWGGLLCGKPAALVGHRQGERNLIAFTWNNDTNAIESQILDHDCGPANVMHYVNRGKDIVISANREIDEVAMYTITE